MNRLKGLSLLIAGVFWLMVGPINAKAACSLSSTPNGSAVTLNATGCEPGSHYYFRLYKSGQTSTYQSDDTYAAEDGSVTRVFTGLENGDYNARLFWGISDEMASSSFFIANASVTPLKCGDLCNPNDTTCPASCPSVFEGGQWKCKIPEPPPAIPETGDGSALCCPDGYSDGFLHCPFSVDRSKQCCKRYDLTKYNIVDKYPCGETEPNTLQCPPGYTDNAFDCPVTADLTKQCCRRNDWGNYDFVDKIVRSGRPPSETGVGTGDFCGPGSDMVCSGVQEGKICDGIGVNVGDGYCHRYPKSDACWCGGSIYAPRQWCDPSGTPTDTYSDDNPEVATALGCLPITISGIMEKFIPYFFGITGGISFLLMVYGFILMATSSGDPKAVAGAQETITSAIKGLLLSAFGIFMVRLIILDILKLPGIN